MGLVATIKVYAKIQIPISYRILVKFSFRSLPRHFIKNSHYFLWLFKDRANEIYKKVEDQKPLRGRNQDAILAACLYIACRQEDKPRTVKGIARVVQFLGKMPISFSYSI